MDKKVLIVDDREVVRTELRNLLNLAGMVQVVGEAGNGWEAIKQSEVLRPDVVVMDLEMPGLDGWEATRQIKNRHLAPVVIVFTVYGSECNRQKAKEAGADAFLVKGTDIHNLFSLLEQIQIQED